MQIPAAKPESTKIRCRCARRPGKEPRRLDWNSRDFEKISVLLKEEAVDAATCTALAAANAAAATVRAKKHHHAECVHDKNEEGATSDSAGKRRPTSINSVAK